MSEVIMPKTDIPVEKPADVEMGSAPRVIVRTIEETLKDQQWERDELDRKKARKAEAERLAGGSPIAGRALDGLQEFDAKQRDTVAAAIIENRHAPGIDYSDEQFKYQKMWEYQQYRAIAPGEDCATYFKEIVRPRAGAEVIDFGCGTGRGALMLAVLCQCKVHMLDFANNSLDEDVRNALTTQAHVLKFTQHDLMNAAPVQAEYGFCTDVMEHIPTADVDRVLTNILRAAQHVFFQISTVPDNCGKLIGHDLHLTVQPYEWWLKKFQDLGAVIHWSRAAGDECLFYVTAWTTGEEVVKHGILNVLEQQILDNVKANLELDLKEIQPHATNDDEVMILCGGPSLNQHLSTIRDLRDRGIKVITVNGTYKWAIDNGLGPVNHIMVDAREFNARFVDPVDERSLYFISSQCHPSVLPKLPADRTYLWHTTMDFIRETINEKRELWFAVPGGSTVVLRAIPLFRLLGFRKFRLFGFDSCLAQEVMPTAACPCGGDGRESIPHANNCPARSKHHAYLQQENDAMPVVPVTVGGRVFHCHLWMISQANEFKDLIRFLGNEIELEVYGDGLIAHMLAMGAAMHDAKIGEPCKLA